MRTRNSTDRRLLAVAGLAGIVALLPTDGHAAVEFVTPVGSCNKVDRIGDGSDLTLQAGQNVRFEVWGSGIDVSPAVRVTEDDGNPGNVSARIVSSRNGAQNQAGPCHYGTGSVLVEVDSPAGTTQSLQRSLRFRMPLGDESRLQTKVVPFPKPDWKFITGAVVQNPANCLTKGIGSIVQDQQDTRVVITLPAGAGSDTSNCTVRISTRVGHESGSDFDITRSFNYALSGVPAFMRPPSDLGDTNPRSSKPVAFDVDVANLRATTAARNATLTIATPNDRTDSLTVVVNPPPVNNAFTQAVKCLNLATGTTVNANDAFQCEINLSQTPPAGGQRITFQVVDRLCVAAGSAAVTYSSVAGAGTFTAPATGTIHQIPLRALGGTTSAGSPCASQQSPVAHVLKFWIGDRDTESGPDFSQTQIRIRAP